MYEARDGMTIPAYLTTPNSGSAPYPTVVMPHGGPWARDDLRFDLWAQFLANRGYLVLQPQYRGSQGWGQNLWRAGDKEWGGKMQDDKDDGARWLVEQGFAAKDRIAMYGYSYGGYAAMASIVRPDTPYQCAIAGAGLSELRYFDKVTFEGNFGREFQNPTIKGLSPLDVAKQASIPIYIFHGDRDQRVPIEQSQKYVRALKRANKDVEYQEIVDLWHSLPWFPQHHLAVLSSIEDYLANRCGPGGL
jgi:dipeptidyl aminopeptidase/acylaminoacyl peptidase